ncbi:hypothetical protein BJ508DRAFT_201192, partial [Ascobolus immersus RN42]
GFVQTAITAYNGHHHLVIRPDDIWISILSQYSLFLNAERHRQGLEDWFELLRDKEAIVVECHAYGDMDAAFRAAFPSILGHKELEPWLIPAFSTTTEQDKQVATCLMMGTLTTFNTHPTWLQCGIPSVTLLGEKLDYEEILSRVERLGSFGNADVPAWVKLLKAVLEKAFIAAFEMEGKEQTRKVVEAWEKICDVTPNGTGPKYLSGWVTVFSFFGKYG